MGLIFKFSKFILSILVSVMLILTAPQKAVAVLVGDINGDNKVDIIDIGIIIDHYGRLPITNARADVNTDGKVDIIDIGILIDNYGRTATPAPSATPGPTSSGNLNLRPFGVVTIAQGDIKFNLNGAGANVDSISFWEADDPSQSHMFVTSKNNTSIEVYKYPYSTELRTITCGANTNGIWVDQETDTLYITQRSNKVCAFDLPSLNLNNSKSFTTGATTGLHEPNLTILKTASGQKRMYVSYDNKVYYHDLANGQALGQFPVLRGLETMFGDNFYKVIYIPDEGGRSGVYIYNPDGGVGGDKFGDNIIFNSDEEGIWVYKCPSIGSTDNGEGLIVVSDQKADVTDFEVFNRKTKQHLGKINIAGVNNTDGISITQQSSPAYPLGLLAVIDDDTSTVGVGWDKILSQTGLSCGN